MNQELMEQLRRARSFFIERKKYCDRIRELEDRQSAATDLGDNYVEEKIKPYEKMNKGCLIVVLGFIIGVIFLALILCAIVWFIGIFSGWKIEDIIIGLVAFVPFVLAEIALIVIFCLCIAKTKKYNKIAEQLHAEAEVYKAVEMGRIVEELEIEVKKIQAELNEFTEKNIHLYECVPAKYRNSRAVSNLYSLVNDGRADTLKEAINMYEEQKHRRQIEDEERERQEELLAQMENIRVEQEWMNHQIWMERMNNKK